MNDVTRILHLEDNRVDAHIIQRTLQNAGLACEIRLVETRDEFLAALSHGQFDVILSDSSIPGFDGLVAQQVARAERPEVPFIFVSGFRGDERPDELARASGERYVSKAELAQIAPAIRRALAERSAP